VTKEQKYVKLRITSHNTKTELGIVTLKVNGVKRYPLSAFQKLKALTLNVSNSSKINS
jgi:hypothetical protein